jgi:hypothetical protein
MHTFLFPSFLLTAAAMAQSVLPPFDTAFHVDNLGPISGVASYGGTAFLAGNPNVLLVSPWPATEISAVPLVRNGQGHITGFGAAVPVIAVGGTDGGLAYGPNQVLFSTWFGNNRLNQIKPGSIATDRFDDLGPLGVNSSVGACTFVPAGLPGAGGLKVCSWSSGEFFDVPLTPDGTGTFTPGLASAPIPLPYDIEGLVYAPANVPVLGGRLLACEWGQGNIAAFQIDANGDPLPATRQVVVGGAAAPGGGAFDPVSGDFVFLSNYGLLALRTGAVCGTFTHYGVASPGVAGTPTLSGSGCARIGQTITFGMGGVVNGIGILAAGSYPLNYVFDGLTILQTLEASVTVFLGPSGSTSLPLTIPVNPYLGHSHLYLQCAFFDASTQSGLIASDGIDLLMR